MQKSVFRIFYLTIIYLSLLANIFAVDTSIGVLNIIDKNEELSIFNALNSPEIYLPIGGFFIILIIAFFIKKFYFKI